MIDPGLKKAAAVSFALHMLFTSLAFITIGRAHTLVMPSPYVVSLVSPGKSALKASMIPPSKKIIAPAKVEEELPVEKPSVRAVKEPPEKVLKKYSKKKIAELAAQKEQQKYLADRKSALLAKQKLARVKEISEAKSAVTVTAKPMGGGPGTVAGTIVSNYTGMLSSLIQQEWVFFDTDSGNIFAIISVRISKNGALKITKVERASGNAIFDRSAIKAIQKASPVPPPPYEMELGIRFIPLSD